MLSLRPGEAERYWKYVDVRGPDECWPWKGAHIQKGYGWFTRAPDPNRVDVPGQKKRSLGIGAHVMGFLVMNGPIPDGPDGKPLGVLHRCDNHDCQNSRAHHFISDRAEVELTDSAHLNMQDMADKGRRGGGDPPVLPGVRNGRSKLTQRQVDEIRRLWRGRIRKPITQSELAQRFKVAPSRISALIREETYQPQQRRLLNGNDSNPARGRRRALSP